MAPTVCMAEFPMAGTAAVSALAHRRHRNGPESSRKRRRFALEEILCIETSLLERCSLADTALSSFGADRSEQYYPKLMDENYRGLFIAKRRRDLLIIVMRTIILVQRNRILQRRLNALRAETRQFLGSLLNNPASQQRRSQVPSYSEDSSSTESTVSTLSPPLDADSTRNPFYGVTPSRHVRTDDESSSDKP